MCKTRAPAEITERMDEHQQSQLPHFANPPISEVAVSIAFVPINGWDTSKAVGLGALLQSEYPQVEVQPELPYQVEKFSEEYVAQQLPFMIQPANSNQNRLWFSSASGEWLVQVQRNRFAVNWRKRGANPTYPRFTEAIKPRFLQELERFITFLGNHKLAITPIQQCEITYVNDIPRGDQWQDTESAYRLVDLFSSRWARSFLPFPENLSMNGSFLMPDQKGRLHFSVNRAIRMSDRQEIYQLRLTARGAPDETNTESAIDWLDMGHEWVVRGFCDLTTEYAHTLWKIFR